MGSRNKINSCKRIGISWVGNAINNRVCQFLAFEVVLIHCTEVTRQGLGLHWVHYGGALFDTLRGVSVHKSEVFESV